MTYKAGKRPAVVSSQTVQANHSGSDTLAAIFPNNTLGGQIKVDVKYYVGTWAAAQAASGWMDNTDVNAAEITLYLVENPIPLDENSVYTQQDVLIHADRSEEHTSELQSLMRISYASFCLKKKK